MFLHFSGPWKNRPEMAANGAGSCFFLLIQTLPTFWAEWILIFIFFFAFLGPQISGFPGLQISKIWPGLLHHCKVIPSDIQYAIFKSFAETFSAEANELGLPTRGFDLESFIVFLSAWENHGLAAHVDVQR